MIKKATIFTILLCVTTAVYPYKFRLVNSLPGTLSIESCGRDKHKRNISLMSETFGDLNVLKGEELLVVYNYVNGTSGDNCVESYSLVIPDTNLKDNSLVFYQFDSCLGDLGYTLITGLMAITEDAINAITSKTCTDVLHLQGTAFYEDELSADQVPFSYLHLR